MKTLKKIDKSRINKVRDEPNKSGLLFEKYGKSPNISEYTDREITEMVYGLYVDKKMIHTDGDYFIDLNEVTEIICDLDQATYFTKPTIEDYKTNRHNAISNIRMFYIRNYWLITDKETYGTKRHNITRLLYKIGAIRQGRNNFKKLYSISNSYVAFQKFEQGLYPKDLYHPIKRFINGLFFQDDYRISNFKVESDIKLEKGV
ncbi:MAG: hypothetical protein ABIP68_07080 [Ferruginibacter sp.]